MTFHQPIRPDTFALASAPLILEPPSPLSPEGVNRVGSPIYCGSGAMSGEQPMAAPYDRSMKPCHLLIRWWTRSVVARIGFGFVVVVTLSFLT